MDREETLLRAERRRAVPTPLALALAARRGRRAWTDPALRRRSLHVTAPLARDPAEREALARRHRVGEATRDAMLWRPWAFDRAPLHGGDRLAAALAGGRGVLATYCHYGYFPAISRSLGRCGAPVHSVAGRWILDAPSAPREAQWRRSVDEAGVALMPAEACFDPVVGLLRRGALVAIAVDMPGSEPTTLLGLPAMLTTGPARMALEADALVVPCLRPPSRRGVCTIAGQPLDPRAFDGWRELHHAGARVHDAWMRRAPWAHEVPTRMLPAA